MTRFFALCTFLGVIFFLAYQAFPENFGKETRAVGNVDATVTVSFEVDSYTVDEGATTSVRVILNRAPERSLTIPLSTSRQRGISLDDYSGVPGNVTFNASDTENAFTFSATQDHIDDDGEGLRISFGSSLPAGVTVASPMQTIVHISDDDAAGVTVSPEALEILEGTNSSYTVVLDSQPTHDVTITINSPQGSEIVTLPPRFKFTASDWNAAQPVTVFANPDRDKVNDTGTITHSIDSLDDNYDRATPSDVSVTVIDDDVTAVTVSFAQTSYSVAEGSTTSVEIVLSADPQRTVTIPISTTAEGGATTTDYMGVPDSVTFDSGDTRAAFTVAVTSDEVDDDGESVKLQFGTLPNGVSTGAVDETTIFIADDDLPAVTVSFEESNYSVQEGRNVSVKLVLSAAPERLIAIPINSNDLGGATSTDYSGIPGSVVFGASETEISFTVSATQDSLNDDGESVKLAFGNLPDKVTAGVRSETTVSIVDDDAPTVGVSFQLSSYTVEEGATTSVMISLSLDPERSVTIALVKMPQAGLSLDDYSGVPERIEFDSGETEYSFTFFATGDDIDDDGEALRLSFGSPMPSGVTAGTLNQATVHITDDDTAGVTVEPVALRVEERSTTSYTVVLDSQPTHDVTITINSPSGAKLVTDKPRLTFTSADWHMPQRVTVTANRDSDTEDYQAVITHTIDSSDSKYERLTPGQVDVTIIDNDVPSVTVSFGQANYSVAEGASTTVTVALDKDPERTVTIPIVATAQGGATSTDYSGVPSAVLFNAGETESTFPFTAVQDLLDDDDESVTLTFGALPDAVNEGVNTETTVSIVDDDAPSVTVSFEQSEYSVVEGATTTVNIALGKDPERAVIIPVVITALGGATSADYSGVPDFILFTPGETAKSFTFVAVPDSIDDDGESIKLTFGDLPDRVTEGATNEAAVSIVDDDVPWVSVSIEESEYSVAEGATTTIRVGLDKDPERSVTVSIYRAEHGGATADDYSGVPESVHFNPGETEITITFAAAQDSADDDGESVQITFGDLPDRVIVGTTTSAIVSIEDDDAPSVSVSFGQAMYSVLEGATTSVTISLSADPERSVNVALVKAQQGGIGLGDYSGVPESIVFGAGDTEHSFTFTATGDRIDDDDEALRLTFGSPLPSGVTSGTPSHATVRIVDDDTVGVTVEPVMLRVEERATTSYTVVLDSKPTHDVTITMNSPPGAKLVTDKPRLIFTSTDWHMPQRVTVTANRDSDTEDYEGAITHVIDSSDGKYDRFAPDRVTVTVIDNDVPLITVSFGQASHSAEEGSTTTVKVVLDKDPERTVIVPIVTTTQGGATSTDYSGVPDSVVFSTGDTERAFTFTATQDAIDDDGESVKLTIGVLPEAVTVGATNQATVSIVDDDMAGVFVDPNALLMDEGATSTYMVVLESRPESDVTVTISEPADNSDVTTSPGSLTFTKLNWNAAQTVTVSAVKDYDGEDDTATVTHAVTSSDTDYEDLDVSAVIVMVSDKDEVSVKVGFEKERYNVSEGSTTTVKIVLDKDPQRTVTIPISNTNQNGASEGDYSGVPPRISFNAGDTQKHFTFTATEDDLDDDGETVRLSLVNLPDRVTLGMHGTATVNIIDEDVPIVTVSFTRTAYAVSEGSTTTVSVVLDNTPERSIAIPIISTDLGGATSADYSGVPDSILFGQTDSEKSFIISATQDSLNDDGESVRLTFGQLPYEVSAGTVNEATVSIVDDDVPSVTVSFEQVTYSVEEGATTTVKVKLSAAPERSVNIALAKTSQGGISLDDYLGVPENIAFGPGEAEHGFTFSAIGDFIDDDGEALLLSFGSPLPSGVTTGTPRQTTVHVADDDTVGATIEPSMLRVEERATTSYTVVLDSQPTHDVTITITSPSGAKLMTDKPRLIFTTSDWHIPQRVTVTADWDSDTEDYEGTITHTIRSNDGKYDGLAPGQVAVTVIDTDVPPVVVSFGQASYSVAEGATTTVKVVSDKDPERTITIPIVTTAHGGATSTDYSVLRSFVVFSAGETEKAFTFTATQDAVDDDGETVQLAFGDLPDEVTAGATSEATVSIEDDDVPSVTVTFGMATYRVEEGNDVAVDVMLSADPERTLVIPFEKTHQGGVSNADYAGVPDSVTFNPGDTVTSFTVSTIEDSLDDDFELVKLSFVNLPEGVSLGTYKETAISILDDEVPSVAVTFGSGTYTVLEGDQVTIRIALSDDPERTVIIPVEKSNRGGATNRDYTGVPRNVSFDRGEIEKHFTFVANQDSLVEGNEGVELSLRDLPDGVTQGVFGDSTVTIADDDIKPVKVTFVQSAYEVMEGTLVTIRVRLSDDPQRTLRIPIVHTSRNGATRADFYRAPQSLTFNPGDTQKSFTLSAIQDTRDEEYEVVELSFGPLPVGVSTGRISHSTVTITDPEVTLPAISFEHGMYTVVEGNTKTIVISLSESAEVAVSVPIEILLERGAASTDFLGVPAIVTFERGETESSFVFNAVDDGEIEDGESIRIRFGDLPESVAVGMYLEVTVLITDAIPASVAVSFEQSAYTVVEGSTTTVKVILDRKTGHRLSIPIVVNWSSTSTAVQRDVIGIVTFERGATEGSLEISSDHFSAYGSDGSLSLAFGILPANVNVGNVATSTIWLSDVTNPEGIALTSKRPNYVVIKGNSVMIRMMLTVPPVESVTDFLSWIDSGCLPGNHFLNLPATVALGAGQDGVGLAIGEAVHEHWERICSRLEYSTTGNYIRSSSQTRDYVRERRTTVDLYSVELLIHHCIAARRTMCAIAENMSVVGSMVPKDRIRWLIENLTGSAQYIFTIELDREDLRELLERWH